MGDDISAHSAQESFPINLLPCTITHRLFDAMQKLKLIMGGRNVPYLPRNHCPLLCSRKSTETKNTYHRADPSFTYLLAFFMLLTGIAWGIAYAPSLASAIRLPLIFVFVHFLAISVLVAIAAFFLVGRLLGPGIAGLPGRRRQQGLFTPVGEGETLEFGYCFDVGTSGTVSGICLGSADHDVSGCDTSLLPCLGDALRCTISLVATDIS